MTFASAYLGYGFLISEVGLALWRRSSRVTNTQRRDASSLRVLWIVIVGSVAAGIWLAARGVGPRLHVGAAWGWFSVAVFGLGTALRWWSIRHLGRFFTVDVAVAADHRVVDTGPYRLVRHPSYTGLLLQFAGLAFSLANSLSIAVVVLPILLALLYRIRVEEAALRHGLGAAYVDYTSRTTRLIPWVI